ncbi:MAG: ethanolamine utilization protein EutH [Endomicrobium sp.]|jgi:ethanolamine transporter|nr:ethanolamine utilization protein EutH [Endomicrobium sp.]
MNINDIIIYFLLVLMLAAALDYACGNKLGLGAEFSKAFGAMGTLAIYMAGILCIAPVAAARLRFIIEPVYSFFGADCAMFAGSVIASDTGAYHLALSLTDNADAAAFSGLILGSMLGLTISFLIPYLFGVCKEESRPQIAKGVLTGIITIPLGCFIGGAAAGYNFLFMLKNLIPVILFSIAVSAGLFFAQKTAIRIFLFFGKIVMFFLIISLAIASVEDAAGIVLIKGMTPIKEAFGIIGSIIIFLAGAFVLVRLLSKILKQPLEKIGKKLNINDKSAEGLLAVLANTIAMAVLINDMDDKGKLLNAAFAVGAGFAFGDHFGFTAAVNKDMILPVVIGKLTAGFSALLLALLVTAKTDKPLNA